MQIIKKILPVNYQKDKKNISKKFAITQNAKLFEYTADMRLKIKNEYRKKKLIKT